MTIELKLKGIASLVHIQTPHARLHKQEYFARIKVDNGSIHGSERPLEYDIPLSKEQYDELAAQINSDNFRKPVGEAEGYKIVPHIGVQCDISITAHEGVTH